MTRFKLLMALAAALVLMAPTAWAMTTRNDQPLPDPAKEAEAQAVMQQLRCLVCQGESVANSDADLAQDLRQIVREQITAGKTPDQIKHYMQARYGDWVLLKPPFKTRTLLLWLSPVLLLLIGGIYLYAGARRQHRSAAGLDSPDKYSGDDIL